MLIAAPLLLALFVDTFQFDCTCVGAIGLHCRPALLPRQAALGLVGFLSLLSCTTLTSVGSHGLGRQCWPGWPSAAAKKVIIKKWVGKGKIQNGSCMDRQSGGGCRVAVFGAGGGAHNGGPAEHGGPGRGAQASAATVVQR